jgi:hypothetical protein
MPTSMHTFVHLLNECRFTSVKKVLYASCNIQNLIQQDIYCFHILLVHQFLHVPHRQESCELRYEWPLLWPTLNATWTKVATLKIRFHRHTRRVLILFLVFNIYCKFGNEAMWDGSLLSSTGHSLHNEPKKRNVNTYEYRPRP